ncbi:hypothetical protein [Kineosporia mesophila]|uniref:hypothetical protein n=1 Tax=Kineosporia mesophila TaxID=566012 RepID=UPI001E562861|nr:hypothetical protein [Kineosporia mesophila]MCD5348624.1 hypothetical protein [Kineosporia mesophila]
MRLIGGDETSEAMQMAEAGAMSLAPDSDAGRADLFSTSNLPAVVGGGPDSGGLSLSAASVGAALRATGAPLDVAAVPSSSPASGALPTADPELGPSTEPYTVQPEPASVAAGGSSFGASASAGSGASGSGASGSGRGGQPPQQPSRASASSGSSESSGPSGQPAQGGQGGGRPGRRSPDTGAFVPREMVARRRAAEAMTRAIVMAPPLPPSMMTGSQPMPGVQNPASGPITQPGGPETQVDPAAAARAQVQPGAKNRKRKGRKQGAHTAGIPLNTGANQQVQPPTGQLPTAPGTGSVPIGYSNPQGYAPQGYPQGYAPQGYAPQGYPQTYAPQAYAPQGYQQQGYQQQVPTGSMPVSAMGSVGVPTAPPQQQLYQGHPPRQPNQKLPSAGARWAMFAVVCLVIGGIIAGVMISLGPDNKDPNAAENNTTATPTVTATQAATEKVKFTWKSFDPDPSGSGVTDQGNGTYRAGAGYNSAAFGNLKKGLGLVLDLGEAREISEVKVNVGAAPITVGLRSSDELSTSDLSAYDKAVSQKKSTGNVTLDGSKAGKHRYWMVWVTSLAPSTDSSRSGRYDFTLKDVTVTAPKQ